MSATTFGSDSVRELPAGGGLPSQWIISKKDDLTWFIGSALAGYLALGMMAAEFPLTPLILVWLLVVDGPHVLSTVTRTYLDRAERARLGALLWIPLPLVLAGPLLVAAGHAALFFLFAICWQHFHVVKQHFGFVMLYKAKNGERDPQDLFLDRWFLLASLFVPLGVFALRTQPVFSGRGWLVPLLVGPYIVLSAAWLGRQVWKFRLGRAMNWPKVALLACVVPLQWLALLYAAQFGPTGNWRAALALGLFHGLQYHRLLWFHNRNRYGTPEAQEKHGLAAAAASNILLYFLTGFLLYVALVFLPPLLFPSSEMVAAAVWGFAFTHYVMDAKIWRVRSDRDLAVALKLAA